MHGSWIKSPTTPIGSLLCFSLCAVWPVPHFLQPLLNKNVDCCRIFSLFFCRYCSSPLARCSHRQLFLFSSVGSYTTVPLMMLFLNIYYSCHPRQTDGLVTKHLEQFPIQSRGGIFCWVENVACRTNDVKSEESLQQAQLPVQTLGSSHPKINMKSV